MFDAELRRRKAMTMKIVLEECFEQEIASLSVLNAGGSTGYIDEYLAPFFKTIDCIDIDEAAIAYAREQHNHQNLVFRVDDVLDLTYPDDSFDVVISSQVYEHVADPFRMMKEIYRVLAPGGVCYFSGNSTVQWREAHYGLPLLSLLPRPLAHRYMQLAGKGDHYYEKHLSYWNMKKMVADFSFEDFTRRMIDNPVHYGIDYMLPPGSFKQRLAALLIRLAYPVFPGGYIWILKKKPS